MNQDFVKATANREEGTLQVLKQSLVIKAGDERA